MKIIVITLITVLSLWSLAGFANAQQSEQERIEQLRKQIEELEAQADQFRDAIARQQGEAKTLQGEIGGIENQIRKIQNQINLTNTKINKTELEIGQTVNVITDTQTRIDRKKETVGELLLTIQRRDQETLLATILKHEQLSDFFRQAQYALAVNTSLIDLINDLKSEKQDLENQKTTLEDQKSELEELNMNSYYNRVSLGDTKSEKDKLLKDTKGQEAQYQKMLKEVEQRKALFFTELRELETKVIQGGLYLVHIKADPVPAKGPIFQWPENGHRLTQSYGNTSYARRGAYGGAGHNGIDMAAGFGSQVRAIGDGEIVANGFNSGWGNWVALRHDNNLVSLYAHMSSLSFLRVGTRVKAGEVIGFEGATGNATGSHLHLSIYREFFTYVNEKNGQLYFNYFDGSLNPTNYLP